MSNSQSQPTLPKQNICKDCAFRILVKNMPECIHPDESGVNCGTVVFCSSFQSLQFVDSPCVGFDQD